MSSKLLTKNIVTLLGIFLFGVLFFASNTNYTQAYFNDTETSSSSFSAATFDVLLTKTNITRKLSPAYTDEIEFSTVLLKADKSLTPQYAVASTYQAGNMDFCNAVRLIASHSAYTYNGPLLDFVAPTSTVMGTWEFDLELDHTSTNFPNNATCDTDIIFKAWRAGLTPADSGYTDEERVNIHLTANMVVLNEFLPNPDGVAYGFDFGDDSSDMPQGEWVELYNNSDFAYDLAGWSIADGSGSPANQIYITASNTVPASTIITGRGWLVVYMNKAVFNNSGDRVELRDSTNTVVDSHTYTTADVCTQEPTPDDPNNGDGITVGVCPDVPGNKSYARIPDGVGSWVDPIPTPGGHNTIETTESETTLNTDLSTSSASMTATTTTMSTEEGSNEGESSTTDFEDNTTGTTTIPDKETDNSTTTSSTTKIIIADDDVGSTTTTTDIDATTIEKTPETINTDDFSKNDLDEDQSNIVSETGPVVVQSQGVVEEVPDIEITAQGEPPQATTVDDVPVSETIPPEVEASETTT